MLRLGQCIHTDVPDLSGDKAEEALKQDGISYDVDEQGSLRFTLYLHPRDDPEEATPYTEHIFEEDDVTPTDFINVGTEVKPQANEITFSLDSGVFLDVTQHFSAVDAVVWNILEDAHSAEDMDDIDDVVVYHTDNTNPALTYPLISKLYSDRFTNAESFPITVDGYEFVVYPRTIVPRTVEAQKEIDRVMTDVNDRLDSHAAAVEVENPFPQLPAYWHYPAIAASDYSGQVIDALLSRETGTSYDALDHIPAVEFFFVHDLLLLSLLDSLHEHCNPSQRRQILNSNIGVTNIARSGLVGDEEEIGVAAVTGAEWISRLEQAVEHIHERHHTTVEHALAYSDSDPELEEGQRWRIGSPYSSAELQVTVVGQDLIEFNDMDVPGWFGGVDAISQPAEDKEPVAEEGDIVPILPDELVSFEGMNEELLEE